MSETIIPYGADPITIIQAHLMPYTFMDEEHKNLTIAYMIKDDTLIHDFERISLFYLLALHPVSREHIHDIYNFTHHWIEPTCLDEAWVTHSSAPLISFAFNLYNNFESQYTLLETFSRSSYLDYLFQAIKIRINY